MKVYRAQHRAHIISRLITNDKIKWAESPDVTRAGTIRTNLWNEDGTAISPDSEIPLEDCHIRVTLTTGMDLFPRIGDLVDLHERGKVILLP